MKRLFRRRSPQKPGQKAKEWFDRHGIDPGNPDGILILFEEMRALNTKVAILVGSNTVIVALFIAHVLA